jgi:hypothetical protein
LQIRVQADMLSPLGSEFVELPLHLRRIEICVPLQVRNTDVDDNVDVLQLRQLLNDGER